jgi:hypothetical protein
MAKYQKREEHCLVGQYSSVVSRDSESDCQKPKLNPCTYDDSAPCEQNHRGPYYWMHL